MRAFAIITGVFLAGLSVVTAILVAFALGMGTTAKTASSRAASPMPHVARTSGMMTPAVTIAAPATRTLTIQHVLRGCHVWSNSRTAGAKMRLHLKPGQRLAILDQDVDPHRMVQFAGPMRLRMGGAMMMNHGVTLAFAKKGVYQLGTKTVEMPGEAAMDVKTIGPDNKLRLVVTVA